MNKYTTVQRNEDGREAFQWSTFEDACQAKGIDPNKYLASVKRKHSFSNRCRLNNGDRPKEFALFDRKTGNPLSTSRNFLSVITDVRAYAKHWRQLNNLTGD